MEMDIAALQQLPEVTEAAGLDLLPVPACPIWKPSTIVYCIQPSCQRTVTVVTTPPAL